MIIGILKIIGLWGLCVALGCGYMIIFTDDHIIDDKFIPPLVIFAPLFLIGCSIHFIIKYIIISLIQKLIQSYKIIK